MYNFKHLIYLDAVYKFKNFTQAADSIYVSQPTISAAISSLEAEMGIRLIERSSKNVIFTSDGEEFMKWVKKILCLCNEAETAMKDLAESGEQSLKLGMSYAFMDVMAPLLFSEFLNNRPNAKLHLDEGSMNRHLEMIRKEQLDIAYNGFPEPEDAPDIEILPVSQAEIRLVMNPEHPLASLTHIPISRLKGEHIVMMDIHSKVKEIMDKKLRQNGIMTPPVFNYTQILCMVGFVKTCNYIGILSQGENHDVPGCGDLAIRSFDPPIYFDIGFFYKKDRYLPRLGHELINFITDNEKMLAHH